MRYFEWDTKKAASNLEKHRASSHQAIEALEDPNRLENIDRFVDGELRWQTIGMTDNLLIVLVAHLVLENGADETVRIISARKATPLERKQYEQNG